MAKNNMPRQSSAKPVPNIGIDNPLKIEEKISSKPVPGVNPDEALKIDQITHNQDVPETNLDAPLNIEREAQESRPAARGNQKTFWFGFLFAALIVGLTMAGIYFYINVYSQDQVSIIKTVSVTEPKNTQPDLSQPTINRAEWSFEVLNGSGIAGAAKDAANKLINLGYNVIKVDNADKNNYRSNQLLVSKDHSGKAQLLFDDLKDQFKLATIAGELKDSTASAQIIIGRD